MTHTVLTVLDVAGLLLLSLYLVQMLVAALLPSRRRPPVDSRSSQLRFTFVVPALNEALVIGATVRTLRATAPEADVVVIDDGSDDETAAIVEALAAQDSRVRLLRRSLPQARQGKGLALNWAAHQLLTALETRGEGLHGEVLVVLDADSRIPPELLDRARAAFADPDVTGAQARGRVRSSGSRLSAHTLTGRLLEQQQDLEFFIIRHIQRVRERWHSVGLFGTGQFMRASYLRAQYARGVAAWPDCLTEDFASGMEMRLDASQHNSAPHRMVFLDAAVSQQGLPDLRQFVKQRARWTQGTMQCLRYLPRLWTTPVPWLSRIDLTYFILSPWLNLVIVLSLLSQPLRRAFGVQGLILSPELNTLITLLNVGLQLQWLARYQRAYHLGAGRILFTLVSLPVYGFALFLSLPLAYWNHFTGRRTWDKSTRHQEPTHETGEALHPVNGD